MLHLIVDMAGRRLALDCAQVDAVIDVGTIVPTPLAEGHVVGVTALRSRVVTVIDPVRALHDMDTATDARRGIVTTIGGHGYVVLVAGVEDAVALEPGPLPAGLALGSGWARVARGVVVHGGESLLVVDLAALVQGRGRSIDHARAA